MGEDPSKTADSGLMNMKPQLTYAYLKHLWNGNYEKKVSTTLSCSFCSSFRLLVWYGLGETVFVIEMIARPPNCTSTNIFQAAQD